MRYKYLFLNFFVFFLFLTNIYANKELQKVSVQLEWKHQFEFAGFYAAIDQGYYKEIGLEVTLKEFEEGIAIAKDVLEGKSTFGISSSALILERLNNRPVVLLSSYFKQNALALVTQKDIKTVEQLKGKKLMALDWEIGHTSIGVLLNDYGIKEDDFTFVEHDYTIDKFLSGEVDAMSVFLTSQPYELNLSGVPYNIINPANYGIYSYDVELFTSEKFIINNPTLVQNFIEATNKGWRYAFENKSEIVDLIYEKYTQRKTKESLLFEAVETEKFFKTHIFKIGSVVPELIKLNINMYEKLGAVDKEYKIFDLFNEYLYHPKDYQNEYLDLTQEELAYIKKNPKVTIAMLNNFKPFSYVENGFHQGMSNDIIEEISKVSGLKFTKVVGNWTSSLQGFKNKEVDMISGISHTKERESFALFTKPFFEIPVYVFGDKNNNRYKDINTLIGKKVGMTKDLFYKDDLKQLGINIVEYQDSEQKVDGFVLGEIDYFLASYTSGKKAITTKAITNLEPKGELKGIKKEDLRYGITKENTILYSIIQKSMDKIKNTQHERIINKWIINLDKIDKERKNILNLTFTKKEQEYLKNKKKITYCVDPAWMPFEKIENKKHIGISSDYVKIFSQALDLPFELIPTSSWEQTLQYGKEKRCEILSFLVMETPQRKKDFLFTTPYLKIPLVITTNNEVTFINDLKILEYKKIGIPKGYAFYEILKEKYPKIDLVEVKNTEQGLNKVKNGEHFGFVGTLASVGYLFQTKFIGELRIAGKFEETWELGIGVHKEAKILHQIVQKTLNAISQNEHKEIYNKHIAIKYENKVDYKWLWQVIFFSLGVLLIFIYWNRKLQILNNELKYQKNKAHNLLTIKSNFLANMSHEVRTPMNVILGMTYLLKKSMADEKQYKQLENIERSTTSLLRLINDILDSSKIEAGKLKIVKHNFNLLTIVENMRTVAMTNIEEKEIVFEVIYEPDLPMNLYGDSFRLEQVLSNLISNATKFTHKGFVRLIIEGISHNRYRFSVQDTGIGIPQKDMKHIFEPFTQADDSITRQFGGTGLGLSISKQLVELMGGELSIQSDAGKGTLIYFDIELSPFTKGEIFQTNKGKSNPFSLPLNLFKNKRKIEPQKEKALLKELQIAVARKRPKNILPIIEELQQYHLNILKKEEFETIQLFIKKYRFNEISEILEKYEK